jgi:hypothetical protein
MSTVTVLTAPVSGLSVIGMLTVSDCPAAIRGTVWSTLIFLPSEIATVTPMSVSSESPPFWTLTSKESWSASATRFTPVSVSTVPDG